MNETSLDTVGIYSAQRDLGANTTTVELHSGGVCIQHFSTLGQVPYSPHPHTTEVLNTGASPTPDFSHSILSSKPVQHSTLEHTRYAHTPALSSVRIIPRGPHHSRETKNTLTTLAYCISQTSYAKARILRDSPKLQIHIIMPTPHAGPPVINHSKRPDSP
jgi:hypothetical protein